MDVRFVSPAGVEHSTVDQLPGLLERDGGFVWVDLAADDPDAEKVLSGVFAPPYRRRTSTPTTR